MNLDRNYQKCFWTASGDLDCQSMNLQGSSLYNNDHSYHVPLAGTQYLTESIPQMNLNLGYVPRSCSQPTQVQPFAEPITHYSLPRSAKINSYQNHWTRQATPLSGFTYPTPTPNCASCYEQAPLENPAAYMPFGNQPAPIMDSEASYNWGHGLAGTDFAGSGKYIMGASAIPATEPIHGSPVHQSAIFRQAGAGYGQPFSSQPKDMNAISLVQYKAPGLVKDLGPPDVVDPSLGGIAIWTEKTLRNKLGGIFKRVELHDEKVTNLNPPYIGNVYSWVKINIRSNVFRDILDLFPNVWYDRQKRWLSVRTDNIDNNLATLALICLINKGVLNVRQVRYYDLQQKYMMAVDSGSRHYNRFARSSYANIIKQCALE